MKLEFSADIKGVPAAQVRCCIDCTAEELSIALSDPVYQDLGKALISKLQNHRSVNDHRDNNHKANHAQPNDRVEYLRRVVETEHKCQQTHNQAVDAALKSLQDQFSRALDRITRNIKS